MLGNGIDPVLGVRVSLDLLLVLVVLKSDIELKAVALTEAGLHDCIS